MGVVVGGVGVVVHVAEGVAVRVSVGAEAAVEVVAWSVIGGHAGGPLQAGASICRGARKWGLLRRWRLGELPRWVHGLLIRFVEWVGTPFLVHDTMRCVVGQQPVRSRLGEGAVCSVLFFLLSTSPLVLWWLSLAGWDEINVQAVA